MFTSINISKNARFIRQIASFEDKLHFACACTDGTVLVAKEDGTILWEATTGCFPSDFWVGDIDADQQDELLVAGADGAIHVFSSEGKVLWNYQTEGPLYQVCAAAMGKSYKMMVFAGGADHFLYALTPAGQLIEKKELPETAVPAMESAGYMVHGRGPVKFLRAGDLDGTGETTLVLSVNMRIMHNDLLYIQGEDLEIKSGLQRLYLVPAKHTTTLQIFDANGDGMDELVFGNGSWQGGGVWAFNKPKNNFSWRSLHRPGENHRCDTNYRDTRAVPILIEGKKRIIAQCGHQLCVLDEQLNLLQSAYASFPFMSISSFSLPTKSGVLLASGFGGDENVYRLEFGKHWDAKFEGHQRQGKMAEFSRELKAIQAQIDHAETKPGATETEEPYIIHAGSYYVFKNALKDLPHYIQHNQWVRRQFPYPNLKFVTFVAISEKLPEPIHGGLLGDRFEADEIVQILEKFEESDTCFMLYLTQSRFRSLQAETIERIVKACPSTFVGCYVAELGLTPFRKEFEEHFNRFVDSAILPVLEVLKAHGKKCLFNEKAAFWISTALYKGVYPRLFDGKYKDVIIPCVEDSSTSSPELNLCGRVGLWLAGNVNRWGARTTNDDFGNECVWQGAHLIMSGHQSLRKMISQAALGATVFQFNCGQDNGTGEPCYAPTQGNVFYWTQVGKESMVPFLHLLGKGLLTPPAREEMSGVSRVGLTVNPSEHFNYVSNNMFHTESFHDDKGDEEFVFSRLAGEWGKAPSHPNHFPSLAFNQTRQGTNFVPSTPYGFVPILPQAIASEPAFQITDPNGTVALTLNTSYGTDGESASINGIPCPPAAWRKKLLEDLNASRKELPFLAEGDVFMNALREPDGYTLCIVDSETELLNDKEVTLSVQDQAITRLFDKLSGEELPLSGNTVRLKVPAGTFLLLSAR